MECSGYSYSVKKDNGGANYHKWVHESITYYYYYYYYYYHHYHHKFFLSVGILAVRYSTSHPNWLSSLLKEVRFQRENQCLLDLCMYECLFCVLGYIKDFIPLEAMACRLASTSRSRINRHCFYPYLSPMCVCMYVSMYVCMALDRNNVTLYFATNNYNRSHEFYVDIHSRYNSVVMVMFNVSNSNRTFIVANTHLYWNPEREDIKVAQAFGFWALFISF